ncbi:MAG: SH3 domain-containing protein [Chloroflexi bacterium]|nr:SH3 domain-containing protein [Chloroflexota bacterium]
MRLIKSKTSFLRHLLIVLSTSAFVFGFFFAAVPQVAQAATAVFIAQAANSDPTTPVNAVVSSSGQSLNVRSGPGASFGIVGSLANGTSIQVIGKNTGGDWLQIQLASIKGEGWVFAPAVSMSDSTQTLAVASAPPAAASAVSNTVNAPAVEQFTAAIAPVGQTKPVAITQPANMNVRSGPGTNYNIVTSLSAGTTLEVLTLNSAGDWYQVNVPGLSNPAWGLSNLTTTTGPVESLARLSGDQLPTAPTTAVAATAPALASSPAPSGGGSFAFGITANMWQNDKNGAAGQIKDLGFSWVKQQVRWEFVENEPGAVNWTEMDDILNVMNANGIQVMFSVVTAPQWTRPDKAGTGGPPNDFNVYADFVGKIAARYCGRLGAIEVWNEENLQREWVGYPLDPASYMDLLRRSYTAIKNNCPAILVISGAPTPTGNSDVAVDDIAYLRGMYDNGLARYSDGIGVHPSGYAIPPEVTVEDWQQGRYTPPPSHFNHRSFYFRSTMEASRQVMVDYGDSNKRLWPTEFGWGQTISPHAGYEYEAYISEAQQAQYIVTAFRMMQNWGWVGGAFLWNLNYHEGEMAAFSVAGRPAYEALKGLTR